MAVNRLKRREIKKFGRLVTHAPEELLLVE
jgi:hypothetical protein